MSTELRNLIPDMDDYHFLIVDDKANMRRTIRNMLKFFGFSCFGEADDGDKALAKLKKEYYDFVICDWNMPRMKGVELLRAIREDDQLEELPFLMITGEATSELITEVIEAEVDGYVLKPFDIKTLENKLAEIISQKASEPSPMEAQLMLADHYMEVGCYWQSHMELDKASDINRQNPRLHYLRGLTYEAEGDKEKAEESFVSAKNYGPKFVKAYDKLAEIAEEKGDGEQMITLLETAAKISPNSASRQTRLGQALLKDGRTDEAKKAFKAALKLDPNNPDRRTTIGDAFIQAGRPQEAEVILKECISAHPKGLYAYNRLGIVLRRQKKFDEAIEVYQKALSYSPKDENLHFNLARAFLGAKDGKMGLEHLKKAIKLKPDFEEARELLAKLTAKQGGRQ